MRGPEWIAGPRPVRVLGVEKRNSAKHDTSRSIVMQDANRRHDGGRQGDGAPRQSRNIRDRVSFGFDRLLVACPVSSALRASAPATARPPLRRSAPVERDWSTCRIREFALDHVPPLAWLVPSAGAGRHAVGRMRRVILIAHLSRGLSPFVIEEHAGGGGCVVAASPVGHRCVGGAMQRPIGRPTVEGSSVLTAVSRARAGVESRGLRRSRRRADYLMELWLAAAITQSPMSGRRRRGLQARAGSGRSGHR